jgi:hypothetical protein
MTRFIIWLFTVAAALATTFMMGAGLGLVLDHFGIEYLTVVWNAPYENLFFHWTAAGFYGGMRGMRFGVFIGTLLSFFTICGRQHPPPVEAILKAAAFIMAASVAAALLGSLGVLIYAKAAGPFLPADIEAQVAHPYRVLWGYGLEFGAIAGAIAATIAAGIWLFMNRR